MKLILSLLLLLSVNAFSQEWIAVKDIATLRQVSNMKNGDVAFVVGYREQGDGGGGTFVYSDTVRSSDDGGGIIRSANLPGAFIHEVPNGVIHLKWYGVLPYSTDGNRRAEFDIYDHVMNAQKFAKRVGATEIYIAPDAGGHVGAYWSSKRWELTEITVRGSGNTFDPKTQIVWPARQACIYIPSRNAGNSLNRVSLFDLSISQDFASDNYGDSTAHGILAMSQVFLNNIKVSGTSGDGIRIYACEQYSPYKGNANFSQVINSSAYFCNNGLSIQGCDANVVDVKNFEATRNRRWGTFITDDLGSRLDNCHYAANGTPRMTVVSYNGKIWQAINLDDKVNKNIEPSFENRAYWLDVSDHGIQMAIDPWVASTRYWSGGGIGIFGESSSSSINDCYTECCQPINVVSARTKINDGLQGSNTYGGINSRVMFGQQYQSGAMLLHSEGASLTIGSREQPRPTSLYIEQFIGMKGIHIKSKESFTEFDMQNSTTSDEQMGGFGYQNQDFHIKAGGERVVYIGKTTGVTPGKNKFHNLGSSGYAWKTGYFDNIVTRTINGQAPGPGGSTTVVGISQETFDAAIAALQSQITNQPSTPGGVSQAAFNALQTKVNSLDAVVATKASKEELKAISDLLAALTARVNVLPITPTNNPQLTQIISELQVIINRLNTLPK